MEQNLFKYCVVANLSDSSHFKLERQPGIAAALSGLCAGVKWLSVYHIAEIAKLQGIESAGEYLYNEIKDCNIALIHKEVVEFIPLQVLRQLSDQGVMTSGFLGDEEWALQHTANFVPLFDVTVVYTQIAMTAYSKYGYKLLKLPVGGAFRESAPVLTAAEDIDVLFIGRPYNPRPEIVNFLIDNGINVVVYGSEKWKDHIPSDFYHGFLDNEVYNETLARAKIVLGFMEAPDDGPTHINAKVFDACKNSKFAICTYYPPFYLDYGLVEDVSIVTYRSHRELLEKVNFYLRHPEKRKAIASAMHSQITEHFDYAVLYRQLFNQIEDLYARKERALHDTKAHGTKSSEGGSLRWNVLKPCRTVVYDPFAAGVCRINDQFGKPIAVNSIYRGRLIKKRLPIVDAKSVLVPEGTPNPLSFCGLSWCPGRIKVPYFALNEYKNNSLAMDIVATLESCLEWVLNRVRGTHKV